MRKYILFFSQHPRWTTCNPNRITCISCTAIVACFLCCAGDLNASPAADAKTSESLIYTDKERAERKRLIVNSAVPIRVTHRYIKNALQGQGEIHWDEIVLLHTDESVELPPKADFWHLEYSIEDYSGDRCDVTFIRRLSSREGRLPLEDAPIEMGDTESSSRTVRFDATKVSSMVPNSRIRPIPQLHPEMDQQEWDDWTFVRSITVIGDIDIDGKSAEEITVYVSLSELADGVSVADEFEAWLFHLVRMCRYPDENEAV